MLASLPHTMNPCQSKRNIFLAPVCVHRNIENLIPAFVAGTNLDKGAAEPQIVIVFLGVILSRIGGRNHPVGRKTNPDRPVLVLIRRNTRSLSDCLQPGPASGSTLVVRNQTGPGL